MSVVRSCLAAFLAASSAQAGSLAENPAPGTELHRTVPRRPVPFAAGPESPGPAGANLVYYGGPVIPAVTVYQVIWGTGTFLPGVADGGTATPTRLGDFYRGIVNTAYIDWLCEYNTPTQTIARGNFGGVFTITPSAANNGSTITDAQIQSELVAQINAGNLPYPNANALYMIDFPKGKVINDGGSLSCASGGFCGYHNTTSLSGTDVYYGVLPDNSPGTGCEFGCGGDPSLFNNLTSTVSHELVESITDPAVGFAANLAPPLSWYDAINGEIGDICNQYQSGLVGSDGNTWVVQQEWSNAQTFCIATKSNHPPVANCQNVSPSVFGCSAAASIDNGSSDPDCWDTTLQRSQSPPGPYPVGVTTVTLTVTDLQGATSSCTGTVTVTSTGCSDGIACTTGDACSGAVCSGVPGPPPAEVDTGLTVSKVLGATIAWNVPAGATASDVLRGLLSALPVGPGGSDETCLGDNLSTSSITDGATPPAGDGFWYVVRGESFCGNGTYGYRTQNATPTVERVSTTCP